MLGDVPKQYLPLAGRSVIEWSMSPFLARRDIAGIVVALAADDQHFVSLPTAGDPRIRRAVGGAERVDSVLSGLHSLDAVERDWVLVHDAARPCLHADDLSRLIGELATDDVGGLLAVSVADTLKSAVDDRVQGTVPRTNLWRALTPQMFRFGLLLRALREAVQTRRAVTDDSAAIELLGLKPRLIAGRADNIKITVPEDLRQAATTLQQRSKTN